MEHLRLRTQCTPLAEREEYIMERSRSDASGSVSQCTPLAEREVYIRLPTALALLSRVGPALDRYTKIFGNEFEGFVDFAHPFRAIFGGDFKRAMDELAQGAGSAPVELVDGFERNFRGLSAQADFGG